MNEQFLPVSIQVLTIYKGFKIAPHAADRGTELVGDVMRHIMLHPPVFLLFFLHLCKGLFKLLVILEHSHADSYQHCKQKHNGNQKVKSVRAQEVLDIQLIRKSYPYHAVLVGFGEIAVFTLVGFRSSYCPAALPVPAPDDFRSVAVVGANVLCIRVIYDIPLAGQYGQSYFLVLWQQRINLRPVDWLSIKTDCLFCKVGDAFHLCREDGFLIILFNPDFIYGGHQDKNPQHCSQIYEQHLLV